MPLGPVHGGAPTEQLQSDPVQLMHVCPWLDVHELHDPQISSSHHGIQDGHVRGVVPGAGAIVLLLNGPYVVRNDEASLSTSPPESPEPASSSVSSTSVTQAEERERVTAAIAAGRRERIFLVSSTSAGQSGMPKGPTPCGVRAKIGCDSCGATCVELTRPGLP